MNTAVICRSQAIFTASVLPDGLPTIDAKWLEDVVVSKDGLGVFFLTTYLGRGPFSHALGASAEMFFEHGEKPYPVFEVPSVGPSNAALRALKTDQQLNIGENGVLFVVNVTIMKGVALASWDAAMENQIDATLAGGINAALDGTKAVLDSVVGSYALYQFPLVWQQLTERHSHAFVDFSEKVTTRSFFSMRPDNFIAFRLNASSYVVEDRTFLDPLHKQVAALVAAKLIEPLVFLKDSLWHKDSARRLRDLGAPQRRSQRHVSSAPGFSQR